MIFIFKMAHYYAVKKAINSKTLWEKDSQDNRVAK
jgi:hypothetical protein